MRAIFKIDICELYAGQSTVPTTEPPYRHCPQCGGVLEQRLLKAGDPTRLVCTGCAFVFYQDPKVAVGTIVRTADDRIVLVRRAIEPGYGLWVFPGGYVDRGETAVPLLLRVLDGEGLEASSIALHRPSLDDVFLSLTGHRAESDTPDPDEAADTSSALPEESR